MVLRGFNVSPIDPKAAPDLATGSHVPITTSLTEFIHKRHPVSVVSDPAATLRADADSDLIDSRQKPKNPDDCFHFFGFWKTVRDTDNDTGGCVCVPAITHSHTLPNNMALSRSLHVMRQQEIRACDW